MPVAPLSISEQGSVTIAEFAADTNLDEAGVALVREELLRLVEKDPTRKLLIDMSNVVFASSMALGFLVTVHLKAARSHCDVVLAGAREQLQDVFAITKLDTLFRMYPGRAPALAHFGEKG